MTLDVTHRDAVSTITLRRPEARNAMDTRLLSELLDALSEAVAAGNRVLVLTGAAGAFSAGADLREPLDHTGRVRRMELFCEVYGALSTCPIPTVAAVAGPAVGGGAEVATACDLRVADRTARFRFPGVAMHVPVGPARLVGLVGLGTAKDLVLTGRTVTAEEAHRLGLVQRLVADGEALLIAHDIAATLAESDPDTVGYLRRQFANFSGLGDHVATENDALYALAQANGDYSALTMAKPGTGSWSGGAWPRRR